MGATFSCENNCFQNCSIRKFICCLNSERKETRSKIKLTKIEHFTVSKLKHFDVDDMFEQDDIILTAIMNNSDSIVFLSRCLEDKLITFTARDKSRKGVDDLLSEKFQLLLKKLNKKIRESGNISGCLLNYENYEYSLIGFPIKSLL